MAIYLNASGRGLADPAVTRRMAGHLARELAIGEMPAAAEVAQELDAAHALAARMIGAQAAQTGLSADTSGPWLALAARIPVAGKRVLVAPHEWGDNLRNLHRLAAHAGGRVENLPPLDLDAPDLSDWQTRIDSDVAAIFAPMVTSVAGLRYPVEAIGALPRPDDALFIVDAAQALGQVAVDVGAIGCDALVGTTRKWARGPRGTGLYWIGERAQRMTGLTTAQADCNIALCLGQGIALRLASNPSGHAAPLSARLRQRASEDGFTVLRGDTGAVALRIPHSTAPALRAALEQARISVKWPAPESDEPASGITLEAGALLRISPHIYNSDDEIDCLLDTLAGFHA